MVELPYKEDGFRMVVVLPNEVDGLPLVLEKAAQKGLMDDVFNLSPSGRDVNFQIPKFEIETKLDLNELLPKAFQEAFVKVDEEGATAGAFTGK
ncbi:Chymotrypsin inhibitor CI-8A [Operophtera brumata]|uniref:Chymotrypsin inhibitor CI-8A n=1 Tax=Operophtera brumata TaxID=104452 RepID=A0A0L7KQW3_OPEBR|nr:Chymotrypsin inhibitor CI-8A [Operophtera brumata]